MSRKGSFVGENSSSSAAHDNPVKQYNFKDSSAKVIYPSSAVINSKSVKALWLKGSSAESNQSTAAVTREKVLNPLPSEKLKNSSAAINAGYKNSPAASIAGSKNSLVASNAGSKNKKAAIIADPKNSPAASIAGSKNSLAASIAGSKNSLVASSAGSKNNKAAIIAGPKNSPAASIAGSKNSLAASIAGSKNKSAASNAGSKNSSAASIARPITSSVERSKPNSAIVGSKDSSALGNHSAVAKADKVQVTSMAGKTLGKDFFQPVILPSVSCAHRNVELVMCVPVKRDGVAQRDAIRDTWGSYGKNGGRPSVNSTSSKDKTGEIILIFFIGSSTMVSAKAEQNSLEKEAKIYGDIYQADFIDTYENLTLKSISMLHFVSVHCPNARYVAKIDDDMYVNIPLLMSTLQHHTISLAARFSSGARIVTAERKKTMLQSRISTGGKVYISFSDPRILEKLNQSANLSHKAAQEIDINKAPPFAFGLLYKRASVKRDNESKWFTSEEDYSGKVYPTYLSGTAYAMSGRAALKLYEASLKVPIFWMEDVYITGMCAKVANVRLFHDPKTFKFGRVNATGCAFKQRIAAHQYKIEELKTIHTQLMDPNLKCEEGLAGLKGRRGVS